MKLLSVHDAATVLQLHPSRVRALATRGRLRGIKVGRDWVFEETEVDRVAGQPRARGRMPSWLIEFIWDKTCADQLGHDVSSTIGDLRTTVYTKCSHCGAELGYGFPQDRQTEVPVRYLDSALRPCTGRSVDA
jgi:excisionase family DNA binding protein